MSLYLKNKHSTQEFANPVGSIGRLRLTWEFSRVSYILLVVSIFATRSYCQTGIVTIIGGTGGGHYTGDGGPATAAEIGYNPLGGVLDRNGNYYFSVRFEHRVRRITQAGIITTIAGNGTRGYSGDGSQATAAMLNNPYHLALDSADNLYIAEVEGARVRKVNLSTGIITTVAGNGLAGERGDGGAATSGSFHFSIGVFLDKAQNVYISTGVNLIRKVNASTGIITTYAGADTLGGYSGDGGLATNAKFQLVYSLTSDTADNLLACDQPNARIRCINRNSGIVTTIAGNDSFRYNGEGLPATAANIAPFVIARDDEGSIYFGEKFNNRIRKLDIRDGRIYTIVGTGVMGQSTGRSDTVKVYYVGGIAVDPCNNVYYTDGGTQFYIKKITYPGNDKPEVTISAQGDAKLCYPMPITFTATALRGGRGPTYQWQVNGSNVGTNSPTYTYTPTNGDVVRCILTSNLYCVVNPMDTSNSISVTVFSLSPSTMSITGPAGGAAGFPVTLGATVSIAGVYTIRWYNHGQLLGSSTTGSFTYTKPTGIDTITAVLIANDRNCYDSVVAGPIYIQHRVGVGEVSNSRYTLSPNPVTSLLHIEGLSTTGTMVQVLDVSGRQQWQATLTTNTANIDMSTLPTGVYVLQLTDLTTGERVVERVVK